MARRGSKTGFGYHLTAFLAISVILVWINIDATPHYVWAKWPIIGWGIGVMFHLLSVVSSSKKINKGFVYHLAAYVMVNALLIYVNLSSGPEYIWFKFPLIAWTFMILFHGWMLSSKKKKS